MKDIVARVLNSQFKAIITSGLKCTLEVRRRFAIDDQDLLRETHLILSAAMLLNGLYDCEGRLKLSAEHSMGSSWLYSLYSEVIHGKAIRGFGVKYKTDHTTHNGFLNIKRQLPGAKDWHSSTLEVSSRGLTSEDFAAYLDRSDQIKSFVYINSSFSKGSFE
jgi:hypothetical protein